MPQGKPWSVQQHAACSRMVDSAPFPRLDVRSDTQAVLGMRAKKKYSAYTNKADELRADLW